MINTIHVFAAAVTFGFLGLVLNVVYNAFFHPLRKFPGPFLATTTPLPFIYHRLTGKQLNWTHSLHTQYGEVVRFMPNELSFINPDAWKDIYGYHTGDKSTFNKDPNFLGPDFFVKPGEEAGILRAQTSAGHAKQRRLVSHAFSEKAIKTQEPLLRQYVDLLTDRLSGFATSGSKLNIVDWYNFTTFDIMADLTFGESLHQLEGGSYTHWVKGVFSSFKIVAYQSILRQVPALSLLINSITPKSVVEKRKLHMAHSIERTDKRLAAKTDRPDFFTYILRYADSEQAAEKALNLSQMHSNAATFMIAGTETTAGFLSGVTYQLLKNPHTMDKLVAEIRGAFQNPEDMAIQELAQLQYLNLVVEEGLRMYPPVPGGRPRITPVPGAYVCDHWVPAGTVVSVPHYAAYHSPRNFQDPDTFVPERWSPDSERYASDKKHTLQPFSFGPRNCVGRNLAYHEMRLILAHVLWRFDLELCSESANWSDQKTYILWEKPALMVRLSPRQIASQ